MQQLLDTFKTALETVGGEVKVARDYPEAIEVIREICRLKEIRSAVIATSSLTNQLLIKSALTVDQVEVRMTSELNGSGALKTIEAAQLGITDALAGVAETGTVIVVTSREMDRLVSALPPNHIALLERSRMIGSIDEAAAFIQKSIQEPRYTVSLITGPSSTADIEEILVRGVHGPHSLYVVIIG